LDNFVSVKDQMAGMERLRFMQGQWNVKAYVTNIDGLWEAVAQPKETNISAMLDGACHREELTVSYDGITTRLFFSWSYDPYRKLYRMISCDDQDGLMSVLEGDFEDGTDTVVISDINTGTAILDDNRQPAFFRQLASTKTSNDGFTDIVSESYDGGHSWQPVFRAVHTRKP
jgi:hypothetical protein